MNVNGLYSKLDNGYFELFASEYDILCLSETKTFIYDLSETELENHKIFIPKRYEDLLFGTHGLCIIVRPHLSKYFKLLDGLSKNVIWLRVDKGLIGFEFIMIVYHNTLIIF